MSSALIAGSSLYLVRQREVGRLRLENQNLAAQQNILAEERDAAMAVSQSGKDELEQLRTNSELLRLRNEVAQLRREREAQTSPPNAQSNQPKKVFLQAVNSDARYFRKEELTNVGYATPLLAIQTMAWAMINGTYDQANESLSPDLLTEELRDSTRREQFEKAPDRQLFIGMQVLAQKNLSGEKVELKVGYDSDPLPQEQKKAPLILICPMVKVGNEWKIGGSSRTYTEDWETTGKVFSYVQ